MLTPRRKKKTKTKLNKQWPRAAEGSQTNNSGPTKKAKNGSIACGEKILQETLDRGMRSQP